MDERVASEELTRSALKTPRRGFTIMNPVPLSIVIPSHNRFDLLRLCLAAVQTHSPPSTEVIVVDDGSHEAIISKTALDFPGVRIIRNPRPTGFAVAANRGIAAASGRII